MTDCLAVLEFDDAMTVLDRVLQRKVVSLPELRRRIEAEPARRGNAQLKRLVSAVTPGESKAERLLHAILRRHDIEGWAPNVPIDVGFAVLSVDVAFQAARLIIEIDGFAFHVDFDRFGADRRRQNVLVNAGWTVLRFTWTDLTKHEAYVVAQVRAARSTGQAKMGNRPA